MKYENIIQPQTHLQILESMGKTNKDRNMNTQNTIDTIIDRTLAIIDKGIDRNVGDMTLMQAMELVGVLMDIRDRQQAYVKHTQKKVRACGKACTKMPKRK